MMKLNHLIIVLIMVLSVCAEAAPTGPYKAQGAAFYFVHNGGPLKLGANLNFTRNNTAIKTGAAVVKILDADEKEVFWDYVKFSGPKSLSYDFGKNAPKGIYLMRVSGLNYTVAPVSFPEKKYGVYGTRCRYYFTNVNQFQDAYFLIPEGAKQLNGNFIGVSYTITDEKGKVISKNQENINLDVSGNIGEIWKFTCKAPKADNYYAFGLAGFPVILCPDAATAKAINGSIEKATDGTVYAHKYQVRIHDWMKRLTPADLKVDIVDLRTLKDKFDAEKNLNGILGGWGVFTYINYQLEKQDLNPASKTFGAVFNPAAMGIVNSLKAPYNPYTGKLDNRILLGVLPYYLTMKESDTREDSWSDYCGSDALIYISHVNSFFEGAKSIKDEKMRDLWYDAVKRIADRFSMFRVSCENQSSHFPFCYYALYSIYGNEKYKKMAEDYVIQLNDPEGNPFMKTGYQQEAYGADGTYQGLGQSLQAYYYRVSGDKNALEGCRTVHDFMSHSVVREPEGRLVGSSSFSHRTAGGWNYAQYSAGWTLLKHEIESAAVFAERREQFDRAKSLNTDLLPRKNANKNAIHYSTSSFSPYYNFNRYRVEGIKNPKLPFEKSKNFIRNFNDEFIAIRKPGYYMFQYLNLQKTNGKMKEHI